MIYQGLLFSKLSIAETGVWCSPSTGIDPAERAMFIGALSPEEFDSLETELFLKASFGKETETLAKAAVSGLAEKRGGDGRLRNV